jgi:hypothetical protein
MFLINKTISLCDHCYRHVPAVVYEDHGQILMKKNCPDHGIMDSVVEVDPKFYYGLEHKKDFTSFNQVLFEVTDRCQLSCPHCYHLPDNKVTDRPLDLVIEQIKSFPKDCMPMFAGAEATLRKDFVELCSRVNDLGFEEFSLISNGVRFADKTFSKQCFDAGLKQLCFGLNHISYQGEKIHAKQLVGLKNLLDRGYDLGYVGYTIESLDDVEDILTEISKIDDPKINHYRIRCGSFIGRSSDQQRSFLSNLVKKVESILGSAVKRGVYDDNPYHVMMEWGDIRLRLIQWPDVTNIDMEELATGPWCKFIDGPITNFVHQVIVRDAVKNNNLPMLDLVPTKYHYRRITEEFNDHHWRHHWGGPIKFTEFDWSIDAQDMQPIKIFNKLSIPIIKG